MSQFSRKKRSIQYTFMSILIPALTITLILVGVLIGLFAYKETQQNTATSQESFISLVEQVLSKDLKNFDPTRAAEFLKMASHGNNVQFIELSDQSGNILAKIGQPSKQEEVVSKVIKSGERDDEIKTGVIRYQFASKNYKETVLAEVIKVALLLIIALIVITVVTYLVYRRHIHAPIYHIMKTLLAYGKGDNQAHVDWDTNDEFGTLATAINAMQYSLRNNQRILVDSALRYQDLYNKTPALLFSMNTDGTITDASVYFLNKLRYKKSELIGLSMSDMVCENFPGAGSEIADRLENGGRLINFQTCIRTSSGDKIDVLINTISLPSPPDVHSSDTSLCVMTDISKQVHAQDTVFRQANYDVVTDLPNRFFFTTRFRSLLDAAQRAQNPVTVIFIDLDRFKWVNDTFGHSVGDALLAEAGSRIRNAVEERALVCRFGGDEFIVALHQSHDAVEQSKITEFLLQDLAEPFRILQHEIRLSASIGISSFPQDGVNPDELIGAADTAMYHAKNRGGDAYEYYEGDMHERIERQLQLDHVLRKGIEEERFSLVFQPIVDLKSKSSQLFEVLLRFSHPDFPNISPADFIPLAETTGLIRPIGQFVIRNALMHLHAMDNQGDTRFSLTINLSPRQLQDETFVDFLRDQLLYFHIDPGRIILEITENSLMENNIRNEKKLEEIRQVGCLIAIDDFGTGFSSLSYLRRFAVDILKIDQAFIQRVPNDEADSNLIRGIINMSREMGIAVIAEGVEKKNQYDFLVENGCDMAQGYYFSRPVKVELIHDNMINI
ncbi:MAG: EAL domain-containing protein [Gammaproteobacteria bacterium]|nr:EAL domain-containing protein [Gammaproteobacteria bacterium]